MNLPLEGDPEFSVSEAGTRLTWACDGQDWALPSLGYGAGVTVWPPALVLTARCSLDGGITFNGFADPVTWLALSPPREPIRVTGATHFAIETTTKSSSSAQRMQGDCAFTRDRP